MTKKATIMLAVLLLANTANAQTPDPQNKHAFITVQNPISIPHMNETIEYG
jgi:hypothetical protein